MRDPHSLVEIHRGGFLESCHRGHAVIVDQSGEILAAWGNPEEVILPRSSCKMLQALPLIESGAADRFGLTSEQLALACASHKGAEIHTSRVKDWLATLALGDDDFRCGPQMPDDRPAREGLIRNFESPCQMHNNCSGKHSGFLTLNKHLNSGPEYVDPAHPVQMAVREAFEEMCQQTSPGYGIDGCSAPNFACTLKGLAVAMAGMTTGGKGAVRDKAAQSLVSAMMRHPELVAGEGNACTELMRSAKGEAAIKTGAEGVYVGVLPGKKLGIALKIEDGATRASEAVMAALLVRLGVLDAADPMVQKRMVGPITNRRDIVIGEMRVTL